MGIGAVICERPPQDRRRVPTPAGWLRGSETQPVLDGHWLDFEWDSKKGGGLLLQKTLPPKGLPI